MLPRRFTLDRLRNEAREVSTLASSGSWHEPQPFFSARRSHAELTAGRPRRLQPTERARLERRISDSHVHAWLRTHSTVALPRHELSKAKKRALRECFDLLDADKGGTISLDEISLVMKALGFAPKAIKEAIKLGDRDGAPRSSAPFAQRCGELRELSPRAPLVTRRPPAAAQATASSRSTSSRRS